MCKFFSLLVDGNGRLYYHDWEIRKAVFAGTSNLKMDSHASIAEYHFKDSKKEDKYFKFEYNPLSRELRFDGKISESPSNEFWQKLRIDIEKLDWLTIVPSLILKPVVNPFDIEFNNDIKKAKDLLDIWVSHETEINDCYIIWLWDFIPHSVSHSVWQAIANLTIDSIKASTGITRLDDTVWTSVRDAIWAYTFSFFSTNEYMPQEKGWILSQPAIDLWHMGLVPVNIDNAWTLFDKNGKVNVNV